jgi:hypothetical protein
MILDGLKGNRLCLVCSGLLTVSVEEPDWLNLAEGSNPREKVNENTEEVCYSKSIHIGSLAHWQD